VRLIGHQIDAGRVKHGNRDEVNVESMDNFHRYVHDFGRELRSGV